MWEANLLFSGCQQRVSHQSARPVDTSKTVPSFGLTAAAGDTLSVRRMYLGPASERHLKSTSEAQTFGRSQGENAGGD